MASNFGHIKHASISEIYDAKLVSAAREDSDVLTVRKAIVYEFSDLDRTYKALKIKSASDIERLQTTSEICNFIKQLQQFTQKWTPRISTQLAMTAIELNEITNQICEMVNKPLIAVCNLSVGFNDPALAAKQLTKLLQFKISLQKIVASPLLNNAKNNIKQLRIDEDLQAARTHLQCVTNSRVVVSPVVETKETTVVRKPVVFHYADAVKAHGNSVFFCEPKPVHFHFDTAAEAKDFVGVRR